MVHQSMLDSLFMALAAGDSLGSTSEFVHQRDIPDLFQKLRPTGWPFKQIGGGAFGWAPGAPTDDTDMALALVRSAVKYGEFRGEDVADRFLVWLDSAPHDVGATTRATLGFVRQGQPWHRGALVDFTRNPNNAANGSLMRNGVVPALAQNLHDVLRISILHSVITHFAPLPVICCAAHSWLIWRLRTDKGTLEKSWPARFIQEFTAFIETSSDPHVTDWRHLTASHFQSAAETFLATDFDPDAFNPFTVSYARRAGYCLLTLQIAVWAADWALRNQPFPTPPGFPEEPFARTGGWTLSWVAMIGHDSDTYGATAGPLIWAAVGELPRELTNGLQVATELDLK